MGTPFDVSAGCEAKNVEPGRSTLWASVTVSPRGKALEAVRAPLAVVLLIDVSGSMKGDPIMHVKTSCEIVADLLGPQDQLAIVAFSTQVWVMCDLTPVDTTGRTQIRTSLTRLTADGSTNIQYGLNVASEVLATAPAGLRRVMVVLSDGQPNLGMRSAEDLGALVRGFKLAVSSLGFGLHHDENVLAAIATAGSGRYAYVPDPLLARVDLARAALAHGGIVADQLELRIAPAEGVEVLRILPATPLRHGKHGLIAPIGDVFIDEGRALAIELALDLGPRASGRLVELVVEGRAPDGSKHTSTATLEVDVRVGPRLIDRDAQRAIILVQADDARTEARAQADRGAMPAAASLLRQVAARIDGVEGFVRNDGSPLAELREQLEDEIANYERHSDAAEYAHRRKASMMYKSASLTLAMGAHAPAPIAAALVGIGGPVAGTRHELFAENIIGRASSIHVSVPSANLSRHHARVLFVSDQFVLQDLGSTNGSRVNGSTIQTQALADGDLVELGDAVFRFSLTKPRP